MKKFLLLLVAAAFWLAANAQASPKPSLQETIDALAASESRADGIVDIDLSQFAPIESTLKIYGGLKLRFVNGTLEISQSNRSWECDIINISEDSYLELASGATVKAAKDMYTNNSFSVVSLNGGELKVSGGQMVSYETNYLKTTMVKSMATTNKISITAGGINGIIRSMGSDDISLLGGSVTELSACYDIYKSINIGGCTLGTLTTSGLASKPYGNVLPTISAPIQSEIVFEPAVIGAIAVRAGNYNITDADLKKIKVNFNGSENWEIYYDGECVWFREKTGGIKNSFDLQAAIDALTGPGTIEIPEEGCTLDGPINIGTHDVTLTGGPLNVIDDYNTKVEETFVFSIPEGGKLTLKNIILNDNVSLKGGGPSIFPEVINNKLHNIFDVTSGNLVLDNGFYFNNIDDNSYYSKPRNSNEPYKAVPYQNYAHFNFIRASNASISLKGGYVEMMGKGETVRGLFICASENTQATITGGEYISYGLAILGEASVIQKGGLLSGDSRSYNNEFYYAINLDGHSTYTIYGGIIKSNSDDYTSLISVPITNYLGGNIITYRTCCTGTISGNPNFNETTYLEFKGSSYVAGNIPLPTIQLKDLSIIKVISKLTNRWNIKCTWDNGPIYAAPAKEQEIDIYIAIIDFGKPFILSSESYKLTKADFEMMDFVDLEKYRSIVRPRFNEEKGYVYLGKPTLQEILDDLIDEKGDEENPSTITPDDDGEIDVDEDIEVPGDLQLYIDGLLKNQDGEEDTGTMKFNGGDFHIPATSSVTISRIKLDGCGKGHHIYVDGTLVIDASVTVYNFIDVFIHVRRGGRVIWRGGNAGDTGSGGTVYIPIYIDGGTVEYYDGYIHGSDTGIKNDGGTVIVHGGTISGGSGCGIYNGPGGSVRINYGEIHGGIVNYGYTYIVNVIIHGDSSRPCVNNYGDFYMNDGWLDGGGNSQTIVTTKDIHICGCVDMGDVYINLGSVIYINAEIKTVIRVHVTVSGSFPGETVMISGFDGYTPTQADFDKIQFLLPSGWTAKFDPATCKILILNPAGINDVVSDSSAIYDVYNLQGIKVGESDDTGSLPTGLYIINGEKVMIKN